MLRVGVTGGIGSGKSTVAHRLGELGAVVTDADVVARQVMEPGEPVLDRVRERFGPGVIRDDGSLDRAALAGLVFTDPEALADLDAITGPAIAERVSHLRSQVAPGAVSVFDMPLLVERGLWVHEHVSIVVEADLETRVGRLVEQRGLDEKDVRNRIAAQASDAERRAACDVVLDNAGTREELVAAVDALWRDRLEPWNANLVHGRRTHRPDRGAVVNPRADWQARGSRIVAKLAAALRGLPVTEVSHVGSTSVPGLLAKDVIDVQIGLRDLADADSAAFREAMSRAGYVLVHGNVQDDPHPADADPGGWTKRFYGGCDPADIVHVHVRAAQSAGWRFALLFRDWLAHEQQERDAYAAEKRRLLALDDDTGRYTEAKEPWFAAAHPRAEAWAAATGWTPR
ncbi:dephospho-CoA kinase [Intrasporangium sp.]|uniref:dephospho-CoA kinase n=1 Tax=Intrasporangium sp. TaxID=1925024 RepID=UPI00293A1F85|nr:dephospho-CoA kinase [Intrasporangium sp.]MDV3223475.1 dephospho-CoA kinase [Intrasporangium sp.]